MTLTWEEFKEEGGGTILACELDYQLIEKLHHQSIPEAKKTLDRKKQEILKGK